MEREASATSTRSSFFTNGRSYLHDRAGLRDDIAELIKPHRTRSEKPPFSAAELIVMALVSSDEEHVSRLKILNWIVRSFKHYTDRVVDRYLSFTGYHGTDTYGTVHGFQESFDIYDIPLVVLRKEGKKPFGQIDGGMGEGTGRYSVDTRAARVFLRGWLEPKREGIFRFLDLPPEIRNTIYEMVLQFPSSGLYVNKGRDTNWLTKLYAIHRKHDLDGPVSAWEENQHTKICLPPRNKILALPRVCKQIYQETKTTFYEINVFCSTNTGKLLSLSSSMGPKQFAAVKHIFVMEGLTCTKSWVDVTEKLASQKSYKFLSLRFYDQDWLQMCKWQRTELGRVSPFTKISQISGFAQLAIAASKAEKFELRGECPLIRAYLDEEVQKLKTAAKVIEPANKPPRKKRTKAIAKKQTTNGGKTKAGGAKKGGAKA